MLAGAVHQSAAWVLPGAADTDLGAPGTVLGVIGALGAEEGPVPVALAAATVNRYAVPLARPVTVSRVVPVAAVRRRPT